MRHLSSSKFILFLIYLYMYVQMFVCLQRPERGSRSPGGMGGESRAPWALGTELLSSVRAVSALHISASPQTLKASLWNMSASKTATLYTQWQSCSRTHNWALCSSIFKRSPGPKEKPGILKLYLFVNCRHSGLRIKQQISIMNTEGWDKAHSV